MQSAFPYAIHVSIGIIFLNVDTIIIKPYISAYEMGLYQIGLKFFLTLTIFTGVISNIATVFLSKKSDSGELVQRSIEFNQKLIPSSLFLFLFVYLFSETILEYIFHDKYGDLYQYIGLFSIIIFLRYFQVIWEVVLTVSGAQKQRMQGLLFALLVMIFMDFILIPEYKILGALYASIIAHLTMCTIYIVLVKKKFGTFLLKAEGEK
jgi:O-antigen/teichoic acid export membrane protein